MRLLCDAMQACRPSLLLLAFGLPGGRARPASDRRAHTHNEWTHKLLPSNVSPGRRMKTLCCNALDLIAPQLRAAGRRTWRLALSVQGRQGACQESFRTSDRLIGEQGRGPWQPEPPTPTTATTTSNFGPWHWMKRRVKRRDTTKRTTRRPTRNKNGSGGPDERGGSG